MSLPPWERGLKQVCLGGLVERAHVAPPVGAWIETTVKVSASFLMQRRPPPWNRGLKHIVSEDSYEAKSD